MGRKGWTTTTIGALLESGAIRVHKDGNYGSQYPRVDDFGSVGVPFLTAKSLRNGKVDIDNAPRLADEKADKLPFGFVEPGDVLLSHNATIGRVAIMPEFTGRVLVGTSLTYFRANPRQLSARYFAAYLAGQDFQNQLTSVMSFSTRNQVPITLQRQLSVVVPPLPEQHDIAAVLGALDDKIELNRRINETLEALARTLFQKMMEEGGGKLGKIEDLCTLSRETINPGEFPDETFDHYSIPAFDEGRLPKPEMGESIKSNKFVVPAKAAMISKLNPRIPRIWLPDVNTAHRSIASTEFLIAIPKPGISREWLYGLFSSQAFLDVFATMITGTSGSHQRVKPEYLLAMDMEIPPAEAIQQYTKAAAPLHKRIALNLQESRTLAALRDALLPRLLSGEVRLKGAV